KEREARGDGGGDRDGYCRPAGRRLLHLHGVRPVELREQQMTARLVVKMVRPPVAVVIFLFAAIGTAEAGRAGALHPLSTVIPVILAGWFVHATVLNDLGDEAIDRVNLPAARGRPLVTGDATSEGLARMGRLAGGVALVAALALDGRAGAVVAAGLGLNAACSRRPLRVRDRG